MTTAILSIKKSVFSRIKEFFAAPATQETQELTSFATTPISAVLEVANNSSVVNAKDHHDYAFNPAKVADNQGFAVKKNMPMNLALSLISAGSMSSLMAQQDEGTSLNQEPNARSTDSNAALRNLSYMAGLSPISGIYTAMLAEQKGLVASKNEQENATANEAASDNLSYMAGLAPISGIYTAMLAEQKGLVVSNNEQENATANDAASDNLSYIAGLSPISAVYTAQLAEQKGLVASKNEQESEQEIAVANNTALRNLIYMAGLAPISGIYTAMLAEQQGLVASNNEQEQVLEAQQEPKMNQEANSNEVSDNGAAWRNLSYMAGLTPISGIYTAMLAEQNKNQEQYSVLEQEQVLEAQQEPKMNQEANSNEVSDNGAAWRNLSYMAGLAPISGIYTAMLAEQNKNQEQYIVLEQEQEQEINEADELVTESASAKDSIMALRNLSYMGGLAPISGIYASVLAEMNRTQDNAIAASVYEPSELEIAKNNANKALRTLAMSVGITPISGAFSSVICEQVRNAYEAQQQVEALEPQKNDAKQEHNSLISNFLMRIFTYLGSVELPAGAISNILAYEIRAKQALNNNSNNNENQQPSAFATKALQMLTAMGNVEAVAGNNANVLADDLRAQRDAIVAMQDKVEQKTGSNFSDTAMRLMTYMGAVSPISGISAQALAEQMRAIRDDYERNNKHFAVENDGFAMSPAMSLISGVFCSALAQAQNQTQANTKPEAMIIEALNNQGNLVQDQHEIIKLYQNMYLERGYDQVQSLIMASVSAACNIKNNSIKPLADAATEERVAARWDSIWNQLSVDSSNLDKSMAANEQENVIAFKAPFERYYNTNGQLIQEQINNNKVA